MQGGHGLACVPIATGQRCEGVLVRRLEPVPLAPGLLPVTVQLEEHRRRGLLGRLGRLAAAKRPEGEFAAGARELNCVVGGEPGPCLGEGGVEVAA